MDSKFKKKKKQSKVKFEGAGNLCGHECACLFVCVSCYGVTAEGEVVHFVSILKLSFPPEYF